MGDHKAAVDAYIGRSEPFARPVLAHLRSLIHQSCPDARESIKWSMPFFSRGDNILCNMAAFRAHCSFGFWDRRMTPVLAEHGVLSGNAMGSLGRIRSLTDLPADAVMGQLLQLAGELAEGERRARQGIARPSRVELAPPEDLLSALRAKAGATERFEAMTPSCRREYVEWVLEAKRAETRERRVRESVERILEGKSRNYEYEARQRGARSA